MSASVPSYLGVLILSWSCAHYAALGSPSKRTVGNFVIRAALVLVVFGVIYQASLLQWSLVLAWAVLTSLLDFTLVPYEDTRHTGSLYALITLSTIGLNSALLGSGSLPMPHFAMFTSVNVAPITCTVALLILASRPSNHCVRSVVQSVMQPVEPAKNQRRLSHLALKQHAQAEMAAASDALPQTDSALVARNDQRLGRVIGTLERLLIIMLVTTNSYEALAFVIGAKSFVRYSRFSEEAFAEYFLIGTLTSTLAGVALGLLIRLLWQL